MNVLGKQRAAIKNFPAGFHPSVNRSCLWVQLDQFIFHLDREKQTNKIKQTQVTRQLWDKDTWLPRSSDLLCYWISIVALILGDSKTRSGGDQIVFNFFFFLGGGGGFVCLFLKVHLLNLCIILAVWGRKWEEPYPSSLCDMVRSPWQLTTHGPP